VKNLCDSKVRCRGARASPRRSLWSSANGAWVIPSRGCTLCKTCPSPAPLNRSSRCAADTVTASCSMARCSWCSSSTSTRVSFGSLLGRATWTISMSFLAPCFPSRAPRCLPPRLRRPPWLRPAPRQSLRSPRRLAIACARARHPHRRRSCVSPALATTTTTTLPKRTSCRILLRARHCRHRRHRRRRRRRTLALLGLRRRRRRRQQPRLPTISPRRQPRRRSRLPRCLHGGHSAKRCPSSAPRMRRNTRPIAPLSLRRVPLPRRSAKLRTTAAADEEQRASLWTTATSSCG